MNMIYNASAGTGKTWQVTELYTALVLGRPHDELPSDRSPVDPRRILLMTFTDNAAAELRQRVAERMIGAQQDDDVDLADCARRVLRSLPAAHISTIHAFCAGLLREHALACGLSPTFQTLEDEERDALLDEVLRTELFQRLETGSDRYDPDLVEFCRGISILGQPDNKYSLLNTVRSLLEKADGRGLDLGRAGEMLPSPERTAGEEDFRGIYDRLAAIDAERGLPAKAAGVFQTLEKILQKFPDLGPETESKVLFGSPKRSEAANMDKLTKFTGKEMKPISDDLAELKERFLTEVLYEQNVETFKAFARYAAAAARGFSGAKRARDVVDFGDQLLLTRDLLRSGEFKNLFDWIIVDEVQDTSRVQCDLIEALWGPRTNLVICGDRKQSIYAWRSADPGVMPDLEKEMEKRGECRKIALKQSYRSKDRVLDAVNEMFSDIYDDYESASLEPVEKLNAKTAEQGEGPCVEFLERDSEEDGVDEEMAAVVQRIRLLVDGGEAWRPKFGYNGETFADGEPFRYGDVLILLKRSTHQPALEKALRSDGIPYTSGGKGRGLFERQEVRDLLLFLQVITQPQNDLALVGFLRSPFANVPDDEIVQFGWDGETFDHETLRNRFFESGMDAAERILRFRARIGETLPSQLVRDLVRETGFDAAWAGRPAGEQHLANFKKALDWLRKTERGGQVLIGDVVRRFEKAIQSPPRSGSAEALLPDPEQNAVTIMTIHGAKGLTKRVCFVPDISFGDTSEPGFAMLSAEGRLEMSLTSLTGAKIKSPGWIQTRDMDKAVRKIEQDNVFYVAMTRARDLVVLSGAGTKKPNGWLKQAEGFLAEASPDILRKWSYTEVPQAESSQGLRPEALGCREDLEFQPLRVAAGIQRMAVTELVEPPKSKAQSLTPSNDRRSLGTVGHAVLEELAGNGWDGDIPALTGQICEEAGEVETDLLIPQLETARALLRDETAGAEALFAEHPFVLHRDETILDGMIDLLVKESSNVWKIFDYKFTAESPESALETYEPQLTAYRAAVEKINPEAEVSAALVLIGETVQVVTLPA